MDVVECMYVVVYVCIYWCNVCISGAGMYLMLGMYVLALYMVCSGLCMWVVMKGIYVVV